MSSIKTEHIKVQLSQDTFDYIQILIVTYGSPKIGDSAKDINEFVEMLLNDAANAIRRPNSWEGSNMISLLRGHGWDV